MVIKAPEAAPPLFGVQWGTLALRGSEPLPTLRAQPKEEPRVPIRTFHSGGLTPRKQIGTWEEDLDKLVSSEVWTHIPGGIYLPPLLQVQKDLAMTVGYEVLRPNGAGDATALTASAGANWQCVDEATIDFADYVSNAAAMAQDYYALANTALTTETILGIDVIAVLNNSAGAGGDSRLGVRLAATNSLGSLNGTSPTNAHILEARNLARPGGGSWAVADLNSLQVSVELQGGGGGTTRCYQVYVVVRYTPLAANDAIDVSGARAANRRVNGVNSALGNTRYAFYAALQTNLFKETSSSDHALTTLAPSGLPGSFTAITSIGEARFNNTDYLAVGVRGADNAGVVFATADPTASPPQFVPVSIVVNSADYCDGLAYVPSVGGGTNVFFGRTGDAAGVDQTMIAWLATTSGLTSPWNQMKDLSTGDNLPYQGGSMIVGVNPNNPSQIVYLEPYKTEVTTALIPRRLVTLSIALDATVIKGTRSTIATDMTHVECACFYGGGYAIAGGDTPGAAARVYLIDSASRIIDLYFEGLNGTTQLRVTGLRQEGVALIATCAQASGTGDAIEMMWMDGVWSAYSPLFSRATTGGATIAATPIGWGQYAGAESQRRRYTFVPSGTTLNVYRIFQPEDIFANPILENTTELKHYGSLYCQTIEIETGGTIEDRKTLVQQIGGNRLVSTTAGSYGTVRIQTSADGGSTWGADNTFDTAYETYSVASSGLLVPTLVQRITLDNGSTTEANAEAATPNALPFYNVIVSERPDQYDWTTVIDPLKSGYAYLIDLQAAIETLKTTNPVQRLLLDGGKVDKSAEVVAMQPVRGGLQVTFRTVPGVTT